MSNFCIPRFTLDKLKGAFKSGEISIEKLYDLFEKDPSSMEAIFDNYLGDKLGQKVSSEFEKAFISNQKDALTKVVEKTFNPKQKDLRSNFVKRLEKTDKFLKEKDLDQFLSALANEKLGMRNVSEPEIQTMLDKKKEYENLQDKIPDDSPIRSDERIKYGLALDDFKSYVADLKERTTPLSAKELAIHKLTHPGEVLYDIGNITKSALSTLDNSFFGRQGIKELLTPWSGGTARWAKNFIKSWGDIGRQLTAKAEDKSFFGKQSDAPMKAIKADIFSRPNALNGKYAADPNGYHLGVTSEEAYPSTLIERIPIIGRLFKASEVAFNGGALRMRADLADALIARAEKNGVDVMDKAEAKSLGNLTGMMTGRGDIGKLNVVGKQINALAFSIKFLKANFDTLFSPITLGKALLEGDKEGLFAKKQAALNLLQIVSTIGSIAVIANTLHPGTFQTDPRSTNFGKLKINNHFIDITGGLGSIVTLISRMIPDKNGNFWETNSLGKRTQVNTGKFGAPTVLDGVNDFIEGKLSPVAGTLRDLAKGQNYQGEVPTPENIIPNLVTPISIQNFEQLKNPSFGDALLVGITDGLGFNTSTPTKQKKKK